MKKLAILFTMLFAASTVADAQFYVGGKADFEVDAYLGLFAIDFKHEVKSNEDSSVDDITFENNFGLGVNNGKALAFGFVYNF